MAGSRATKTVVNLFWRFLERCGAQAVSLVVSLVLARILGPEASGTLQMVVIFTTIMQGYTLFPAPLRDFVYLISFYIFYFT